MCTMLIFMNKDVLLLQYIMTTKLNFYCELIINKALLQSETHGTSEPMTVTRPL